MFCVTQDFAEKGRRMRVVFIVFFVVIFGVTTSVFAKENVFDHPIPENTFPLELKKLSDRFERFQSIRTRFVQTKKISVLIHHLVTKGLFVSAPEYGVYWKIESPFDTEILITSGGYYQRKDGNWISETPASAKAQIQAYLKAFLLVFSGKFEELREYFTLSFLKRENAWNVGLSPKGQLKNLILNMQLTGSFPAQLRFFLIQEVNGDFTKIEFHDARYSSQPLSESEQKLFQ